MFKGNKKSSLYKRTNKEKCFFAVIFVIFALYAISLVYPFIWLFFNSLKDSLEYLNDLIYSKPFALPKNWIFSNYIKAFNSIVDQSTNTTFFGMFFNSIWITTISVFGSVFSSCLTGYCIAKYKFKLRNVLYAIAIFSMTIPIVGTTGASFKLMSDLGIYNTPLFPILTTFSGFGFNFLIMYAFFQNVPWDYAEAAFIDGAGHGTVFFKIMLEQAAAPIFTLCIISFIGVWNDYMNVLLYMPSFPTLASGLYNISKTMKSGGDVPTYFAALIISILPILILFVSFSDVIMKNYTMGGLKG